MNAVRLWYLVIASAFALTNTSFASILYVDDDAPPGGNGQTWNTAFRFLQDALTAAAQPEADVTEVRIAQGVYKPDRNDANPNGTADRNAAFRPEGGLTLVGGWGGLTSGNPDEFDPQQFTATLSGDLLGNDLPDFGNYGDNCYHVIDLLNRAPAVTLVGFEIIAGAASGTLESQRNGGGVSADGTSVTITNCRFYRNLATGRGGGLFFLGSTESILALLDSLFLENRVAGASGSGYGGFGGGASIAGISNTFTNCSFALNASAVAGAVDDRSGSTSMYFDCSFHSNFAQEGGALRCMEVNTRRFERCTFTNNSAGSGGAIQAPSGHLILINCDFQQNVVTGQSPAGGGAINLTNSNLGNTATLDATNCRFLGNTSIGFGGAIQASFTSGLNHRVTLDGCLFSGNSSTNAGGAIYGAQISGAMLQIVARNCTVASNNSGWEGGGLACSGFGMIVKIYNSIFWNNSAPNGSPLQQQITWPGNAVQQVNYSCIQQYVPAFGGLQNIASDPQFIDRLGPDFLAGTLDDNLRLSPTSPCIDAGNNWGVLVSGPDGLLMQEDADGDPRFSNGETRPDPGCGAPVAVDIGAYEFPGFFVSGLIFADTVFSGSVDVDDLIAVILAWGPCSPCCLADLNIDGIVDVDDLVMVITNWS
jgi:predicted outer membrane repeat protein